MKNLKVKKIIYENIKTITQPEDVKIGDYVVFVTSDRGIDKNYYGKIIAKSESSMVISWLMDRKKRGSTSDFTVYTFNQLSSASGYGFKKVKEDEVRVEVFI